MKKSFAKVTSTLCLCVLIQSFNCVQVSAKETQLTPEEVQKLGTDVYIYGYPLITMDITRQVMTNVESVEALKAPMGQFVNAREYPNASFRDVTAPNADTLYSSAWIDVGKEPYILQVPDEGDRYYLMPMLSGWTDVFADPGTRTTGTKAQKIAIVGPNWKGTLPKGVKEYKSETDMVWILGRTYCTGTPEDYKKVHELQDNYKLTPLSAYAKEYTPPKGKVDPNVDMKTPVRDQVNALNAKDYFNRLAMLLENNPPTKEDAPMLEKMAKLGIKPGQAFDIAKLSPEQQQSLEKTVKLGQETIMGHFKDAGVDKNGWIYSTKTGLYGTDYLQRALIAAIGLGANRPQDAIYPTATVDSTGAKLNGANKYVMHFAKGQEPPVKGFWSLTMYDDKYFFTDNALNRYTVSPRNDLKKNEDGSLDLYIQHESPGKDKESNWLPAPSGNFILMLRFYWPQEALIKGTWTPPGVVKQ